MDGEKYHSPVLPKLPVILNCLSRFILIASFHSHLRDTLSSSLNEPPTSPLLDLCLCCFLHWEYPCLTVAHLTHALKRSANCYLLLKGFPSPLQGEGVLHDFLVSFSTLNCCLISLSGWKVPKGGIHTCCFIITIILLTLLRAALG